MIEDFIIRYKTDHPGADKATITPLLKAAYYSSGVKPVSESTVGRIIHDLNPSSTVALQFERKNGHNQGLGTTF